MPPEVSDVFERERLWETVETLGAIGETADGGIVRVTGNDADEAARDTVVGWFEDAGLDVSIDPVGNVVGRRSGRRDLPPVVTGSHLDTVPNGGRFDGAAGVLAALEVVRGWNDADVETDHPLDVVVFTEEEGTRFGTGLLGSLVASGALAPETALAFEDDTGRTLGEALEAIGYRGSASFDLTTATAFVELHVEQGPKLDDSGVPIGVVESIAGITHHDVRIEGESDHAGNTPMDRRADAFMGAAQLARTLEDTVREASERTVGTVGRVEVSPNATNVVPGAVELGVDLRDPDGSRLDAVVSEVRREAEAIADRRGLGIEWETSLRIDPREMDPAVIEAIATAAEECGLRSRRMESGAGHDAMNAAPVVPSGMVFVPSEDGVSHSPAEYTAPAELHGGTEVLGQALRGLAETEGALSSVDTPEGRPSGRTE